MPYNGILMNSALKQKIIDRNGILTEVVERYNELCACGEEIALFCPCGKCFTSIKVIKETEMVGKIKEEGWNLAKHTSTPQRVLLFL